MQSLSRVCEGTPKRPFLVNFAEGYDLIVLHQVDPVSVHYLLGRLSKNPYAPPAPAFRRYLKDLYPPDWAQISQRIRFQRARGRCEWCGAAQGRPHPVTGSKVFLTTAHLDHDPANNADDNLAALCQKCHNTYDAGKRHANGKHRALAAAGQLPLFGPNGGQVRGTELLPSNARAVAVLEG